MTTISQQAADVRSRPLQGRAGALATNSILAILADYANSASQAKQVTTITVGGATNSHDYVVTVNNVDVTYTSDASASIAEIAQGLSDAINAEPLVAGSVAATYTATTCVVTSRWPGISFTLTESDGDLSTAATTANANASTVGFGLVCVDTVGRAADDDMDSGAVALDSLYSKQVITLDYTYNASDVVRVTVVDKHTGKVIAQADHTLATSKDASTTAIAGILNAQLPANSVIAANAGASGYELTLTSEKDGFEFDVAFEAMDNGTTAVSVDYTTGPDESTSLLRSFVGISVRRNDVETETVGGTSVAYAANEGFVALQGGADVWVDKDSTETISDRDAVWVEMDDSAGLNGRVYNTASSTRVLLPGYMFRRQQRSDAVATDSIAVVSGSVEACRARAL